MSKKRTSRLILEHLGLVSAIAHRLHEELPNQIAYQDLCSAGIVGLVGAAGRWRPDMHVPFPAYAKHRIAGSMRDWLREIDWMSRDQRKLSKAFERVGDAIAQTYGRPATDIEIATACGISLAKYYEKRAIERCNPTSLEACSNAEMMAIDPPANDEQSHPDRVLLKRQMRIPVSRALSALDERSRRVVALYYSREEPTMKQIGIQLGIQESRVSQLHTGALQTMRVELGRFGMSTFDEQFAA